MSDDISDDYSPDDGKEKDKIMWNQKKVTQGVHKTLRWVSFAALKGMLLIVAFTGRDKTKLGKVKFLIEADGKIF
jgi:hypothetical protein